MDKKKLSGLFSLCLVLLLNTTSGWSDQDSGKTLECVLESRATKNVQDSIKNFQGAAEQAENTGQKAAIMSDFAAFLIANKEWKKSIEVCEVILKIGSPLDRAGAYYGMAQAYLMINELDKAKTVCKKLRGNCYGNTMEEFANNMKEISPTSIHGKLAELLADTDIIITESASDTIPFNRIEETKVSGAPGKKSDEVAWKVGIKKDAGELLENISSGSAQNKLSKPPSVDKESPANTIIATGPVMVSVVEVASATGELGNKTKEPRLSIGNKGWSSELSGSILSNGMSLDMHDGTNLGRKTVVGLNGSWKFSKEERLCFDYTRFENSGSLTQAATFNSLRYLSGANFNSRTSFFSLGLSRFLYESKKSIWKVLYGMNFSRMLINLSQQTDSEYKAGKLDVDFSIPYLGIDTSAKLSRNVTLNGLAKFYVNKLGETDTQLKDFDLLFLFGRDYSEIPADIEWYGVLGYRYFLLHGKYVNDVVEESYFGPTFGLESRF
ncbi:MAG: hypothetical protein HQM08_06575 [Candidatus Riflebacteria bacterium]|nr:hypothetical protein [Candidatus Riflebacteria bacterium]